MKTDPFHTIPGLILPSFHPDDLQFLRSTAEKFHVTKMRFTPGNQLAVAGITESDLPLFIKELGKIMNQMPQNGISSILTCPGCGNCKFGINNTDLMAEKIQALKLPLPMPAKCKVAIAGCKRCCTIPFIRDIGLIPAEKKQWQLVFGGNGSSKPRIADIIAVNLCDSEAVALVHRCLSIYQKYARHNMRTSRFIEHFGLENFKNRL